MKRTLLLMTMTLFWGVTAILAQYPIPSYRILVEKHATFQEKVSTPSGEKRDRAKRKILVRASCASKDFSTCSATIWIYSLDGLDVLGPFTVTDGEILVVEIDDREWGCRVITEDPIVVDVWIEEDPGLLMPAKESLQPRAPWDCCKDEDLLPITNNI